MTVFALMPRKLKVQQGTTASPVKTPAEDWRLADGALWTPSGSNLQERAGVIPGAAAAGATRPLDVTAAAGGVFTVYPGRFYLQGSAALQGGYVGVVDAATTLTIAPADLPASGSYKAGLLIAHGYDQVYGDTRDGWALEYVLGASAGTQGGATYPPQPTNSLQLRQFTVDSAGAITLGSTLPKFTLPRGGVLPVATEAGAASDPGVYAGQMIYAQDTGAYGFWEPATSRWIWYDTKWQTYTPIMSNGAAPGVAWGTPGNAVITGRYYRSGRTIQCRGNVQLGTTTSYGGAGAGNINATYPPGYVAAQATWQTGYSLIEPHGVGMMNNQAGYSGLLAGLYPGTPANRRIEFWSTGNPVTTVTAASGTYGLSSANHALSWDITYETAFEA